ncbi:S8 family peptidase [Flavobacterium sp. ZB4R12]|uniref:S8 family peptidase n=1 Tax=Flavobacterium sp. ZB4R12 TaxID=3398732 RepID=UPI003AAA5D85
MKNKSHILIKGNYNKNPYKTPKNNPITPPPISRDRMIHGGFLLEKIGEIKKIFDLKEIKTADLISEESVYVEFTSEWGTKLDFDKFDKDGVRKNKILFQLLKINEELRVSFNKDEFRYSLLVVVNEGGVSEFINKIKEFLNPAKDTKSGNFSNQALLNNISNIEIATLKSFWVDAPEIPFPKEDENIWWEVWFRKSEDYIDKFKSVYNNLDVIGCKIGQSQIELAEYIVKLVKGTSKQLSDSLLLLDNLAELRNPQEVPNFITHKDITFETKKEYLEDLKKRTENNFDENSVLICLLDTGINNKHPLLEQFVSNDNLFSYNESWGLQDSYPNGGHGTGVAGLALYGDLTEALNSSENIQIYHGLESFKIFGNLQEEEKFDGPKFENAISIPSIYKPNNLRVYCLTILRKNVFKGRPSSSSATIDKICFGKELGQQLFIVSSGNVEINRHEDYPALNEIECINDPAQAYNALTIGTYTRKDKIDISTRHMALAENGAMAPSNSTSLLFDNNWPNKPDLVFEGGNRSTDGVLTSDHSELRLLTTDADFANDMFISFGDTSGAAGLAAKMAAELRTMYPNYWVETIRGLMVHSAGWTEKMIENAEKMRHRLRTVGYGVPNLQKALFSLENSLTLIAEREIQPYKFEKSKGQYNEYHLFSLPWPKEALEILDDKSVKLIVTLSYYIEPNPGSRKLATHYSYHSHQLDFEIINRNEDVKDFQIRISKPETETKENRPSRKGVSWEVGNTVSSKGSLRKDFITLTGREMSERNILAVFPKNGWYKNLKRQNKFNEKVRYSLIISLETEEVNVDLYTPVLNQLAIPL